MKSYDNGRKGYTTHSSQPSIRGNDNKSIIKNNDQNKRESYRRTSINNTEKNAEQQRRNSLRENKTNSRQFTQKLENKSSFFLYLSLIGENT